MTFYDFLKNGVLLCATESVLISNSHLSVATAIENLFRTFIFTCESWDLLSEH